ncbi:TolC family protein [Rhodoferax sp. GW822-FHT02A01]|uniref:TolC family protein n=1 Tax=Rhodoferax sp. GW822-FHT02A01 TaxID=3141537 RepID=UPI00315D2327
MLTLGNAIDLALCNNPQLRSSWAAIKVQAGALGEAKATYLPTLSATLNKQETTTEYVGARSPATVVDGQSNYASLSWRLLDFGGRHANQEAANDLLLAALANHDAALQKTLGQVIQAYFDAQTARATVKAKEEEEAIARNTLESAMRREAHGTASHADTLQAITALAKASLDKNRSLGSWQKNLAILVYAIGIRPQTQLILADDPQDYDTLDEKSLQAWMDTAEQSHPAIRAARAQWEAALQKVAATRSEGMPVLDFSANYYQNGYPGQGLSAVSSNVGTVGIAITVPLFDGFSRTYKIRGAQAQAEQREGDLLDTRHNTLMAVVQAHADALAAVRNLESSQTLLSAAQESLASSQRRYDKGAASIVEILNTQATLADAQQERIRCLSEWRSARLHLLTSAGVMGREVIAK